jgi:hypothetical protein
MLSTDSWARERKKQSSLSYSVIGILEPIEIGRSVRAPSEVFWRLRERDRDDAVRDGLGGAEGSCKGGGGKEAKEGDESGKHGGHKQQQEREGRKERKRRRRRGEGRQQETR